MCSQPSGEMWGRYSGNKQCALWKRPESVCRYARRETINTVGSGTPFAATPSVRDGFLPTLGRFPSLPDPPQSAGQQIPQGSAEASHPAATANRGSEAGTTEQRSPVGCALGGVPPQWTGPRPTGARTGPCRAGQGDDGMLVYEVFAAQIVVEGRTYPTKVMPTREPAIAPQRRRALSLHFLP